MSQTITAIFEDGVLKPSQPLNLSPRTRVRLTVELVEGAEQMSDQAALGALEQLWKESHIQSHEPLLSRDELHERR